MPARKNLLDRISRLKAAIEDDDQDTANEMKGMKDIHNAIERLTKTQECLVACMNNLTDKHDRLLEKINSILHQQLISKCSMLPPELHVPPHPLDTVSNHSSLLPTEFTPSPELKSPIQVQDQYSTQVSQGDDIYNLRRKKFALPKDELHKLSRKSCSEGNFAAKLLPLILQGRTSRKKLQWETWKLALDKLKLEIFKQAVFRVYSLNQVCRDDTWKKCIIAMDKFLRQKCHLVY